MSPGPGGNKIPCTIGQLPSFAMPNQKEEYKYVCGNSTHLNQKKITVYSDKQWNRDIMQRLNGKLQLLEIDKIVSTDFKYHIKASN